MGRKQGYLNHHVTSRPRELLDRGPQCSLHQASPTPWPLAGWAEGTAQCSFVVSPKEWSCLEGPWQDPSSAGSIPYCQMPGSGLQPNPSAIKNSAASARNLTRQTQVTLIKKATWVRPVIRKSGCEIKTAQAKPRCQVSLLHQKQDKWNKPFKEVSSGLNNLPEQKKSIKPIVVMIQKPMVSLESFLFSGTCCFVAMPVLSWKDAHTPGTVSFSPN